MSRNHDIKTKTIGELQQLNTRRLLALKRRLTPILARYTNRLDWSSTQEMERHKELALYDVDIRSVLSTREHIERKT